MMNLKIDKAAIICDNFGYVGKIEDIEGKVNYGKFTVIPSYIGEYSPVDDIRKIKQYNIRNGYAICRDDNKVKIFSHRSIYMINIYDIMEFYFPTKSEIQSFIDNYKLYNDTIKYIINNVDTKKMIYEPHVTTNNFNAVKMGNMPIERIFMSTKNFSAGYDSQSLGILYTVDAITFDSAFTYIKDKLQKHNLVPENIIEIKETPIRFSEYSKLTY